MLTFLQKKEATELILASKMCWVQKKKKNLAFIQQRGSDSSQTQCSKHASTGLPLSSNTQLFSWSSSISDRVFFPSLLWCYEKVLHSEDLWVSVCWFKMERNTPKKNSPQKCLLQMENSRVTPSLSTWFPHRVKASCKHGLQYEVSESYIAILPFHKSTLLFLVELHQEAKCPQKTKYREPQLPY